MSFNSFNSFAPFGGKPAFSPLSIPGIQLWLKADSLDLSDGSLVTTWSDSSGWENHALQPSARSKPVFKPSILNGKPVVMFGGGNIFMEFPSISTARTVFIVHRQTENVRYSPILGDDLTYPFHGGESSALLANYATAWTGTGWVNGAPTPPRLIVRPPDFNIISLIAPQQVKVRYLTRDRTFTERSFRGDVAEILIYSIAIDAQDRQKIERYLAAKWAIALS